MLVYLNFIMTGYKMVGFDMFLYVYMILDPAFLRNRRKMQIKPTLPYRPILGVGYFLSSGYDYDLERHRPTSGH